MTHGVSKPRSQSALPTPPGLPKLRWGMDASQITLDHPTSTQTSPPLTCSSPSWPSPMPSVEEAQPRGRPLPASADKARNCLPSKRLR
jgi:hypothetical protein